MDPKGARGGLMPRRFISRRALLQSVPRSRFLHVSANVSVLELPTAGNTSSGTYTVFVGNQTFSNCILNETLASYNGSIIDGQNATNFTSALKKACTGLPPPTPPPPNSSSSSFPAWAIAVIVAAGVLGLAAAAFFAWFMWSKTEREKTAHHQHILAKGEPFQKEPDSLLSGIPRADPPPGDLLRSVPTEGGNEVLRESDLQPQRYLSTARGASQAVRKFAQEALSRARGSAGLERLLRTRGAPPEAALALLEELCARALLRDFENPGLQAGPYRTNLSGGKRMARFKEVHDEAMYGSGDPPGFREFLESRKDEMTRGLVAQLGLPVDEARDLLLGPALVPHFEKAALLVYAVNAGAFAFQRPAYIVWADEGSYFDADWFKSSNPRVETGRVGVSSFPAVVITRNQLEPGRVFALKTDQLEGAST